MSKNDFWHFLGGVILALINIDWIVIPAILIPLFEFTWPTYIFTIILANIELVLWYKFWRWFLTSWLARRKKIKETIEFAKEIASEAKEDEEVRGYLDRIVDYFENTFKWATNPNKLLWKIIKFGGHVGAFFLGAEPIVAGGRVIGVLFCATTGWRNGIYSLCIGNVFHVIFTILWWKTGLQFWDYFWKYIL